jgi:hypothetical protein
MGRRIPRDRRPFMEEFERRELLSAITDVMAADSLATSRASHSSATNSGSSVAAASHQGPVQRSPSDPLFSFNPINNQALAPTGTPTRRQQRRERFVAQYEGTYTVGVGATSDQKNQVFITAAGSANTMLHSDIQMLLVTPNDPTEPIGGVSSIFDRNLNSNSALGFDLSAPQTTGYVNKNGLPDFFSTVSLDANISAGAYIEGFSQGTMNIRYIPSGKHTKGVISQGTVVVTIHAQVYSAGTSFILRNSNIDP